MHSAQFYDAKMMNTRQQKNTLKKEERSFKGDEYIISKKKTDSTIKIV